MEFSELKAIVVVLYDTMPSIVCFVALVSKIFSLNATLFQSNK